jgi:cysteine-rich repeat protein
VCAPMRGHIVLLSICALAACGDNLQGPTGNPPVVDGFALTTDEDTPVTRAVTATGGAGALTLTASAPAHGTIDISGLSLTYTPEADYNGSDEVTVTISDGTDSDTAMVAITVAPVNDPPTATADSFATNEDTVLTIPQASVLANDTDVDGDTLTVTALGTPAVGTATITGSDITFTPPADFVGTTTFDYTISDGTETASASITIAVGGDNDAPVAGDDTATTDEDTAVVITNLLDNDTDPEGQTLSVTGVANAMNGTVTLNGNDVTFTPSANFNGAGSFDYIVSDGAAMDTGSVTVTVAAVNDPPVADDEAASTQEDTAVAITEATLLAGDTDVEGDPLTVMDVGNATNGTVVFASGTATFTPTADFNGTATFDYTVTDGTDTDTGTVTITVTSVNDAPVAGDDAATVQADSSIAIPHATLLANDTDVDGPPLTISAVGNAVDGTITLEAGTVTFTPTLGHVGTASFEYTAFDGSLGDVALVTVTVTAGPVCGDGNIVAPEQCDDTNTNPGDGCDMNCQFEVGWTCALEPSVCAPICGDNMTVGDEPCDDGDMDNTDGCTTECVVGALCDVATIPGGDRFSVDADTGHCFVSFDDEGTTFAGGQTACVGIGGYLATVTTASEEVAMRAAQNPAQNPWIGAGEDGNTTDMIFDWVTDEPFGFTRFAAGEPDDDGGVGGFGDCLHLSNAAGEWADTNCTIDTFVVGRICEVEPAPCGDSILQASEGEQCDDGNTAPGDGCSATCQLETLAVFSFTGAAGSEATFSADGTAPPPGLAALPEMSRGTGVVASAGINAFAANNWTTDLMLDATDYFSFTVTPAATFSLTLTALELDERRSGSGIRTWTVRSSLDSFAADLQVFSVPDDDTTRPNNRIVLPPGFAGLTSAVEFRIYGYASEGTAGTWRVDNVELYGFTTGP